MVASKEVPESQFAYVVVAAKRARQLMAGRGRWWIRRRFGADADRGRGTGPGPPGIQHGDAGREGSRREAPPRLGGARAREAMQVALGVTGGVAAYKAVELVRQLQQDSLEVQVVMTDAACEFVRPLTFAALTGRRVITGLFGDQDGAGANIESAIEHIAVAQRIDLLVVAPATADALAKFANGAASDFLTTLYLATKAPVIIAPAMNVNMWEHEATRKNVKTLRERGVHVVEPDEGYLACGMMGAGRLAATSAIAQKVREVLGLRHDLEDETVLVTAGPTRERIDRVRYLTNRSSGKMGYALAEAACRRGARVVLVSGPVNCFSRARGMGAGSIGGRYAGGGRITRARSNYCLDGRGCGRLPACDTTGPKD